MLIFHRNRTSTFCVMYALYLYFLGLRFRSTSKAIAPFDDVVVTLIIDAAVLLPQRDPVLFIAHK